jgi:hypothetical protein
MLSGDYYQSYAYFSELQCTFFQGMGGGDQSPLTNFCGGGMGYLFLHTSYLSFKKYGESLVTPTTVIKRAVKDHMVLVLHIEGTVITLPTFGCSSAPPFKEEVIIFEIDHPLSGN